MLVCSNHIRGRSLEDQEVQSKVKTSVFGAEFVVIKQGIDMLIDKRSKLRIAGIPISDSLYINGKNMSVAYSTSKSKSVLKKKSNSVC